MSDANGESAAFGHDGVETSDFAPVHYSTAELAVPDRIPIFREVFGQQILHLDIEPTRDHPFQAEAALRRLPGVRLAMWDTTGLRLARTRAFIPDNDDAICLIMHRGGTSSACGRGRSATLKAGDAVPLHTMEPCATQYSARAQLSSITVPRASLAPLIANIEDAVMQVVPPDSEALRLLQTYLEAMVCERTPLAGARLRHLAAAHIHDLVALAIGASRDGAAQAESRGLPAAQLPAVKADIVANLGRRDLSLGLVSKRQRLSPRHVGRLFQAAGTTFSAFVLEQRLSRAHAMLADARYGAWTVSAIAFQCGFGDLSYFNRAFRRRFGATPSDVRMPDSQ